eukprot:5866970-Karenia_brevis.AAC.1
MPSALLAACHGQSRSCTLKHYFLKRHPYSKPRDSQSNPQTQHQHRALRSQQEECTALCQVVQRAGHHKTPRDGPTSTKPCAVI